MRMRTRMRVGLLGPLLLLLACGATQSSQDTEPLTVNRLYPLAEGQVWSYNVETGGDEPPTLAISRVVAVDGNRFEIQNNRSDAVRYEVRPEGIYAVATESWLIRNPIEEGREWPAGSGRTARIASVDVALDTAAGHFDRCVRVEEGGGRDGRRIVTIYCPDVGPVVVESSMDAQITGRTATVRAELLGYGSTEP